MKEEEEERKSGRKFLNDNFLLNRYRFHNYSRI